MNLFQKIFGRWELNDEVITILAQWKDLTF